MADAGVMITWGENIPGREARGLEVFNETLQFWGRMQAEGKIESFEVALLAAGGPVDGFIFARGDRATLAEITGGDEHTRLVIKASMIVQDVTVSPALINEGLAHGMEMYQDELASMPALAHA
jgi:hypothetical protein